jgi:hypothetical protein
MCACVYVCVYLHCAGGGGAFAVEAGFIQLLASQASETAEADQLTRRKSKPGATAAAAVTGVVRVLPTHVASALTALEFPEYVGAAEGGAALAAGASQRRAALKRASMKA